MRDVERYASHGYVTGIEEYEADDRKLARGIDGLYDAARKVGLGDDVDLEDYRLKLRQAWVEARNVSARQARADYYQAKADRLRQPQVADDGTRAFLAELGLDEARRRARR